MRACKILIFGGTTEGRKLAEYLAEQKIQVHVCVATAYGESLLPENEYVSVTQERMDEKEMEGFLQACNPSYVIDATHPYAEEVTKNIKTACEVCGILYLRVVRESAQSPEKSSYAETIDDAVHYLEGTRGNILVTTGSKELEAFTRLSGFRERVYARILPFGPAVSKCEELGFKGRHLICMQGPFTEEMNLAMLREYQIRYLVTKESGVAGGYPQKCSAACKAEAELIVIGRPKQEDGYSLEEIEKKLKKELKSPRSVFLVGIGTGTDDMFTLRAKEICRDADLLIGAKRMLKVAAGDGQMCYTAYHPEEILSYILEHPESEQVAVVLSGDTGFYSGAKKLLELLKQEPQIRTEVIPGISSVACLCAKLGITWEDAALLSLHGRSANLIAAVRGHQKTITLAGKAEDIRQIGQRLTEYGYGGLQVCVGADLSYETEQIWRGTAEELHQYAGADLAVVYIENPDGEKRVVTHGMPDHLFLRGEVPMTKEEVRSVSLSKLELRRDSIVYDIGAGTGSVAIEAALQADQGWVYAIERKKDALELIRANQKRFGAANLTVVEGEAPEVLAELPAPDCVFIGGSGGHLPEILETLVEKIAKKKSPTRIVVNAITLETLEQILSCCRAQGITEEVTQMIVSRSRTSGKYHMMIGQNPVYVVNFTLTSDS